MREIVSAKAKTRSRVMLLAMFILLLLATGAEWLFFKGAETRLSLSANYDHNQIMQWLVCQAFLTTAMLVGLWYRQVWLMGLLKLWLTVELFASGIIVAWAMYTHSLSPATELLASGLRLIALGILIYPRDMRLFLSISFMDTYTSPHRSHSHLAGQNLSWSRAMSWLRSVSQVPGKM